MIGAWEYKGNEHVGPVIAAKSKWIESASDDSDEDTNTNVNTNETSNNMKKSDASNKNNIEVKGKAKSNADQLLETIKRPDFLSSTTAKQVPIEKIGTSFSKATQEMDDVDENELTNRDIVRAFEPVPAFPSSGTSLKARAAKLNHNADRNNKKGSTSTTEKESAKVKFSDINVPKTIPL